MVHSPKPGNKGEGKNEDLREESGPQGMNMVRNIPRESPYRAAQSGNRYRHSFLHCLWWNSPTSLKLFSGQVEDDKCREEYFQATTSFAAAGAKGHLT
jgi:hypothetical protein